MTYFSQNNELVCHKNEKLKILTSQKTMRKGSGFDSVDEDEEDFEDDNDDGNVRPCSPLVQQFPPEKFWQGWRQVFLSLVLLLFLSSWLSGAHRYLFSIRNFLAKQDHLIKVYPQFRKRSKESAPSTSGLRSSTERSR